MSRSILTVIALALFGAGLSGCVYHDHHHRDYDGYRGGYSRRDRCDDRDGGYVRYRAWHGDAY